MDSGFEQDLPYLQAKFRSPRLDPSTGLENGEIKQGVMALAAELEGEPHPVVKARAFEYVTRHTRIDVSPHDWYVGFGCFDRNDRPLSPLINQWNREVDDLELRRIERLRLQNRVGTSVMWKDFDHSVPDWDAVFALGFPGLRRRAREYRRRHELRGTMTPRVRAYFDGIDITYGAILEMLGRFRNYAIEHARGNERMLKVADCMKALSEREPRSCFEVFSIIYLFFMFSEHIDRFQVRSLGNLDRTLLPYFRRDLEEKRCTEEEFREFLRYFLMQYASIDNYWGHPFYLGGTAADGSSEVNELSRIILDEYDKLDIHTPKIQIKVAPNTPRDFLNQALDMVRRGHSSIVFVSEAAIARVMTATGYTSEEARTCDITGCYEFSARGRSNQTVAGYVNCLKSIELALHNGVDPATGILCGSATGEPEAFPTYESFETACLAQLGASIDTVISCSREFERYLSRINPAQVYSGTIEFSLEAGRDAFQDGVPFSTTAVLTAGIATLSDALMAVKHFVYDRKELSLREFREILDANWEGHEKLRLRALRLPEKFGNGLKEPDRCMERISRFIGDRINFRPNARGGVYIASSHPARTFITLGEKTGATPDGRKAGEEMSKNISPTMGMDVNGVTALLNSVGRIDSLHFPGDYVLDLLLHPAAVAGPEGLDAMRTLLEVYMKRNGIGLQFNIFDAETLVEAQQHPERYRGLQIRVCGWNVLFNNLSRKEQDAYIRRARNIGA